MREKILQVLREKGHGVTPEALRNAVDPNFDYWNQPSYAIDFRISCEDMEEDKLLILHRSSGSAGVPKGEITLVCLRQEGH